VYIEKLANMYADLTGRPSIPWDKLETEGHGLSAGKYDPAYHAYLDAAFFSFLDVVYGDQGHPALSEEFRHKYKTIRAKDARGAIGEITTLIEQAGSDIWSAVTNGDWGAAVKLPNTLAMDSFATFAANAVNNFALHNAGVIEAAMLNGNITPEEVMAHADSTVQTFATFVDLNKSGDLEKFKSAPPVAGMGFALPVVGIGLVLFSAVLVGGACYIIYVTQIAAPIQDKAIEYCDQLAKSGNDDDKRACLAALQKIQENGNADLLGFLGKAISPIVWVAAVGLGLYVAAMVLPGILARRRMTA
jgi:hypothetical protein